MPIRPLRLLVGAVTVAVLAAAGTAAHAAPATPIQHLVVIFQENVSFDHYFATYPEAANPAGEPPFHALPDTPRVNGLSGPLLHANPNATAPFRLGRDRAATCDQDHSYLDEQLAYHAGLVDRFVETLGNGAPAEGRTACARTDVMGYYDGNTVTALWNYAQRFAMSDQSFATGFGPSTPGALNLVAGNTHGGTAPLGAPETMLIAGTVVDDGRPFLDDCSPRGGHQAEQLVMEGKNVGDLLEARGVTWGWFQGGFRPTGRDAEGRAICGARHTGSDGQPKDDYVPHHEPFQYWPQTSNPHHLPPSAPDQIGRKDPANHQYDLADFWVAVDAGRLPAVSFLKAPAYQDGHAGYSDPLAEQRFLVETLNRLQRRPEWASMAVVIAWDDSDGWYDHVLGPIVFPSASPRDGLTGSGACGTPRAGGAADTGRCGYGPRLPLLVISPWAKQNHVDHATTDQASILRFIEDNWDLGRIPGSADAVAGDLRGLFDFRRRVDRRLLLDPVTGEPVRSAQGP